MKCLVFDTGPLISLALNNLLWILRPLKEKYGGEFYIPGSVKKECVEKPLQSKKFKFEALQILKLIEDGTIKIYDEEKTKTEALYLLENANSIFKVHDNYVKIVQFAEIETISVAKALGAEAIVIDEFTTRTLLEDPFSVHERLERKLHLNVDADKNNIKKFRDVTLGVNVIRSFELVMIAYELGLFKDLYLNIPNPKKTLLEGLLWAIKLNGCSISEQELMEAIKIEKV